MLGVLIVYGLSSTASACRHLLPFSGAGSNSPCWSRSACSAEPARSRSCWPPASPRPTRSRRPTTRRSSGPSCSARCSSRSIPTGSPLVGLAVVGGSGLLTLMRERVRLGIVALEPVRPEPDVILSRVEPVENSHASCRNSSTIAAVQVKRPPPSGSPATGRNIRQSRFPRSASGWTAVISSATAVSPAAARPSAIM